MLAWRTQTLYVITYFAGAMFLFVGLVRFVDVFLVPAHRWLALIGAVIFLTIGVIIVAWPHITLYAVDLLIALGFLLWGVLEVVKAFSDVHARHWWVSLIGGVISLIIAVWAIRHPAERPQRHRGAARYLDHLVGDRRDHRRLRRPSRSPKLGRGQGRRGRLTSAGPEWIPAGGG